MTVQAKTVQELLTEALAYLYKIDKGLLEGVGDSLDQMFAAIERTEAAINALGKIRCNAVAELDKL